MSVGTPTLVGEGLGLTLGSHIVLGGVDIAAPAGQLVGVLGPNGAGKSSLLTLLAGLRQPDAGRVTLDGLSLASMPPRERARRVAFMPQARTVHWPLTVAGVVALGRLAHTGRVGSLGPADRAAVHAAMADADLGPLAERTVDRLSGGELARVLLARALAQGGDVLIADEPTAGLDLSHQLEVMLRLGAMAAAGKAIVVALHDLSLAARFCHHIVLLAAGRVMASGRPAHVLTQERVATVYGVRAHCGNLDGVPIVLPLGLAR